jgi:hypothetical protein
MRNPRVQRDPANRRQEIESATFAHKLSKPSPYRNFKNISRSYHAAGVDGRPVTGSKKRRERREEHPIIQ